MSRGTLIAGFVSLFLFISFSCSNKGQSAEEKQPDQKDSTIRLDKNYLTDCKKLFADARKMDSMLLHQTEADITSANQAIKAFTDFAYYCASDSLSPMYLIKVAQIARAINNIPQAKVALEKCIENYPSFKNKPAALFLLAQLYDEPTYLNNEEEARKLYQKIIYDYPKSDWAVSAKGAISFLGKSDAQILEELKKKKH